MDEADNFILGDAFGVGDGGCTEHQCGGEQGSADRSGDGRFSSRSGGASTLISGLFVLVADLHPQFARYQVDALGQRRWRPERGRPVRVSDVQHTNHTRVDLPHHRHPIQFKARTALTGGDRTEDPHWIRYFDAAELAGTIGGRLLEPARRDPSYAGEAAEQIGQAIALRDPNRRRSAALDQLNMVEARLIEGELEEACRIGRAALAVAEQTASDRVAQKLTRVYNRTGDFVRERAVIDLRERMRPLVTATATA
ncbi:MULTISPECIES: hypothetical protein [Nocardia]|uniref:hypothetical protein n=1 Tax=Nocardia abscessus TaxID=120957 RepID=UPI001894C412|nr:hypothetical protein [Nocardia abscessus]MBF6473576.1 hypothetical protein [Nocardia abscessus]